MPRPSASGKFVRFSADDLPARTPQDIARLKAAMDIPVEPSEELESARPVGPGVRRDATGRIVKRPLGLLRAAILASLDRHKMTRYELWKKAHARCESLSASAVYEYLRGDREIGSEYMEALIEAAKLEVVNLGSRAKGPGAASRIEEPLEKMAQSAALVTKKVSPPPATTMKTAPGSSGASKDSGKGKPAPSTTGATGELSTTTKKPAGLKGSRGSKSAKAGKK